MQLIHSPVIKATESLFKEKFSEAMSYKDFRSLVDELAAKGQTSGSDQKESLINYTQLNSRRMKRWDKTFTIPENIKDQIRQINRRVNWLVLTESWCGDAAPTMPVMNKIAESNPNIELRVLLRDEHLDLMHLFRTDGSLSIPKLIGMEEKSGMIVSEWGPRPSKATKLAMEFKRKNGILSPEFKEELQRWYNTDKGQNTLDDLLHLLALK